MFELLSVVLFVWLLAKAIGLTFRITWGAARVIASLLLALALPLLAVCFLFAGGLALLLPVAVVALAAGIVKACMD